MMHTSKIKGNWFYYYGVVDKKGQTIDGYLSLTRDIEAACVYFEEAIFSSGLTEKINIDRNGCNISALDS